MEYIALNNWRELKKQRKYKEAAYALYDEIAYNLLRVHNKYSNIYLDENKYFLVGSKLFLREKIAEEIVIERLRCFRGISYSIEGNIACYEESKYEGDFEYTDKKLFDNMEKEYKNVVKMLKKWSKNNE